VLDGMERVCLGVGYRMNGVERDILPFGADLLAECEPVYEELPGWSASTVGITCFGDLPQAAQAYLNRVEQVCGVPIDLISTGADREQTIVRRHPFD
jgi:adenylosuccinate synthase